MNYCKVMIGGRLTRDVEVKSGGVAKASVAFNRKVKSGEDYIDEPVFVDVTLFGARGEAFAKHHSKGDPVFIEGSLRLDSWQDKNTGSRRQKLYVAADSWQFIKQKAAQKEWSAQSEPPSMANVGDDFF